MTTLTDRGLVAELRAALPEGALVTDPDRLASYRNDQAGGLLAGQPAALVLPRTTGQVSVVLAAAHRARVPVVPRGAGSGLSGGANAVDGCLVLSLEKMTTIRSIDAADGCAVVEPGVVNQRLRDEAAGSGLWYAPDPASRSWCTLGGNIATNAGGLCCVKYGVTRDADLALEVVLADGRTTRIGRRSVKGVAGYDLVSLIVGSEGTLGVVTEATLRLRPAPLPPTTVVAVFPDLPAAGRAVQAITSALTPSLLELMDRTTIRAVEALRPMGLDVDAAALLLAQTDSPGPAEAEALLALCEAAGAVDAYRSEDAEQADQLLEARRLALPALERMGAVLLDDVAVPRSQLVEAIARIERVAVDRDVVIGTFGHAGDGNLHPTVVLPHGDQAAAVRGAAAFRDIVQVALDLGGTVTGEHGVGMLKPDLLARELDPTARSLHAAIKQALDPRGILNPGKALPLPARAAGPAVPGM